MDTRAQKYILNYILKDIFKTEKCFTEINISKVKWVLQVKSQHTAYIH